MRKFKTKGGGEGFSMDGQQFHGQGIYQIDIS